MEMNFGTLLDLDRGQHQGKHIEIYYSYNINKRNKQFWIISLTKKK